MQTLTIDHPLTRQAKAVDPINPDAIDILMEQIHAHLATTTPMIGVTPDGGTEGMAVLTKVGFDGSTPDSRCPGLAGFGYNTDPS